eukprot:GHVU01088716.1.p2 GENE.GHVU01088716.1~~GHVU01088716.1.p2  ORF type:complete len:130 (+),score=14.30 GHVU01088716.1:325-714(+)
MVERTSRKTVFKIVENRTKETLCTIIKDHVMNGSTIYHDDWASYRQLHDFGYQHATVVHTKEFKSAEGVCTNTIEGLWGNIKGRIISRKGIPQEHLQEFLDEFSFRHFNNNNIFHAFCNVLHLEGNKEK